LSLAHDCYFFILLVLLLSVLGQLPTLLHFFLPDLEISSTVYQAGGSGRQGGVVHAAKLEELKKK
jgi:hypothetical protein